MKKGNQYYQETTNQGNSVSRKLRNGGIIFCAGLILILICAIVLHQNFSPEPTSPSQSDDEIVEDTIKGMAQAKLDYQTRVIDVSGRFYEAIVGYGDEPIEFGSLNSEQMDLIDVIPPSAINDSPEERRRDGDFEGYIKPNTPHKVRILVDNESSEDAENVQVWATICWVNQTRLRLIAQIFYGTGSVVEYAEDFWVNDDSEVWLVEPTEVSVVNATDGTALDVPEGHYWVGGQPIPVSSESACFVEYTLKVIPRDTTLFPQDDCPPNTASPDDIPD